MADGNQMGAGLKLDLCDAPAAAVTRRAIVFAGARFILDARGAAYLPDHDTLVASDLHLEKGSAGAARGRPVPCYDTHDTLIRLTEVIEAYEPKRVICLGDSFHDGAAHDRMTVENRAALVALCRSTPQWTWISGNHDPATPAFCPGEKADHVSIDNLIFRHLPISSEPQAEDDTAQVIGHFHPKATLLAGGRRLSGPCFHVGECILIMPAFGAYTGGLSIDHSAIQDIAPSPARIYMLHSGKIWRVR